jgi:uncharacterized protein (DUF433 family)
LNNPPPPGQPQLSDFLTQDADGHIRFAGHRIGLLDVVYFYNQGYSPEMLADAFPTLQLPLIHKAIVFYLEHRAEVDVLAAAHDKEMERQRAAAPRGPDAAELRRRLQAKQAAEA